MMMSRRFRPPGSIIAWLVLISAVAGALAVVATVLAILFGVDLHKQQVIQKNQAVRLTQVVAEIQQQRRDNIFNNCKQTNERHDDAVDILDQLISRIPPGPRRERSKVTRMSTVLLLEAIVPYRNCRKLVREQAP